MLCYHHVHLIWYREDTRIKQCNVSVSTFLSFACTVVTDTFYLEKNAFACYDYGHKIQCHASVYNSVKQNVLLYNGIISSSHHIAKTKMSMQILVMNLDDVRFRGVTIVSGSLLRLRITPSVATMTRKYKPLFTTIIEDSWSTSVYLIPCKTTSTRYNDRKYTLYSFMKEEITVLSSPWRRHSGGSQFN